MKLLNAWNKLSKKRKIQVGLFGMVALILIGILIWKVVGLLAEEPVISNIATMTYTEDSQSKTVTSNNVQTTVTTPTGDYNVSVKLQLHGRTDHSASNISFMAFLGSETTPVFEKNDLSTDSTGNGQLVISDLSAGSYDFRIKVHQFLSNSLEAKSLADGLVLDFGDLKGGDFDNNNIVNSLDFSIMMGDWETGGLISDVNNDGIVNSIDFALMNSSWFITGS